ncbi:MAG: LppX_LprAFG lipoprotein [Nocardioides sp.]
MRARRTVALVVAGSLLTLAGCSDDSSPVSDGKTPDEVMALAKKTLDETSGVTLALKADELPAGVSAISAAEGVGTHAPAFDGELTVMLGGQAFDVPVIAVDGTVFAQIPLVPGWSDVDPAEYGAPDPAQLMSTDAGFSSLLPATDGVEEGESVRGGANNDEVLTEFTGSVPGDVVSNVIPSASGDFDATYTISAEGQLRTAELIGVFYPDTEPMTYTIGFDDYGTEQDITAP